MTSHPYPVRAQLTDAIGLLLLCVWFLGILLYAEWLRYPSDSLITQFIGGWF